MRTFVWAIFVVVAIGLAGRLLNFSRWGMRAPKPRWAELADAVGEAFIVGWALALLFGS